MAELERGQSPAPTTPSPLIPPHTTRPPCATNAPKPSRTSRTPAAKSKLETVLRQREAYVEQLEGDRRFLATSPGLVHALPRNHERETQCGADKDRHANLEVLREEKRALERLVLVVDELREKVVSLEAQVEAAKRERQEWANKFNDVGMPSEPSISVVQSLSELRLTHARLLEDHGANVAILKSREAELARTNETLSDAQKVVDTLWGEVQLLKDKVARREQRAQLAEREVGFLQADPPDPRVLCLRDNPARQWSDLRQSVMDRLKSENKTLIKRLRDVESNGVVAPGEELVPRESWEVVQKERKNWVVKQKEKRLLRLQQVFAAKSAEFREAIASIPGLKLAFYPNGQVRVTSMYDLSASFVFQPLSKTSADGDGDGAQIQLVAQGEA